MVGVPSWTARTGPVRGRSSRGSMDTVVVRTRTVDVVGGPPSRTHAIHAPRSAGIPVRVTSLGSIHRPCAPSRLTVRYMNPRSRSRSSSVTLATIVAVRGGWWAVVGVWTTVVALSRVRIYHEEYARARRHWDDDTFTAHLCADNNVRASLGRHDTVCDDAHDGLAVTPAYRALLATARRTYVCGDTPCTAWIRDVVLDMTATLQGLVVTVLVVGVGLPVMVSYVIGTKQTYGPGRGPPPYLPLVHYHRPKQA